MFSRLVRGKTIKHALAATCVSWLGSIGVSTAAPADHPLTFTNFICDQFTPADFVSVGLPDATFYKHMGSAMCTYRNSYPQEIRIDHGTHYTLAQAKHDAQEPDPDVQVASFDTTTINGHPALITNFVITANHHPLGTTLRIVESPGSGKQILISCTYLPTSRSFYYVPVLIKFAQQTIK